MILYQKRRSEEKVSGDNDEDKDSYIDFLSQSVCQSISLSVSQSISLSVSKSVSQSVS